MTDFYETQYYHQHTSTPQQVVFGSFLPIDKPQETTGSWDDQMNSKSSRTMAASFVAGLLRGLTSREVGAFATIWDDFPKKHLNTEGPYKRKNHQMPLCNHLIITKQID